MSTVYLPVEVINRELMSRAFLSAAIAEKNFIVYLFEHTYFDRNGWPSEGIYIGKNCFRTEVPYSKLFYTEMKKKGLKIWYLDEEGGIYTGNKNNWKNGLLCRLEPNDLDFDDKILTWGRWQKKAFESMNPKAEVLISGLPNFDVMQPKYQKSLLDSDLNTTQGLKDFILINTRFGFGNPKIGVNEIFKANRPHSKNHPELYLENVFITDNQLMFDMIELVIFIAQSMPHEQFVIRPHPAEDTKIYVLLTNKIKNIHVIFNGGVEPWIRMSKVLIHNGCTTAIQGVIAEKKVITYLPKFSSKLQGEYAPGLPNTVGNIANSHKEVLNALNDYNSLNDNSWKETISKLNTIDFISKLLDDSSDSSDSSDSKSMKRKTKNYYTKEKIRDFIRALYSKANSNLTKNKFNYKEFSNIVNLVDIANNHYKSNVKCKKISEGCYCVFK